MSFERLIPLTHELATHYEALRRIRTRKALLRSELYARIRGELERVLGGVEEGRHALATGEPRRADRLRVAAWNIQRGMRLDELRRTLARDPVLSAADVVLLVEVDNGLGRSGNRNVARELAESLAMSYAFSVSYLTLEDDIGENPDRVPNSLALAGQAILSRVPITRVENVDLPELRDKFSSSEKRLGKKRALLVELALPAPHGPLAIGVCHLDSNASPAQRACQLAFLLDRLDATGIERRLVGGDFNSTTYDVSSPLALARDLLHKLWHLGVDGVIDNYMTPDRRYDTPLFAELAARGYALEGYNDRAVGTMNYDFNRPYEVELVRAQVGRLLTRWIVWRLAPWGRVVQARLDWFAGRGLTPLFSSVVAARDDAGVRVSDHDAIVVDLALSPPASAQR